jgi:glycosyltransferase involved in cell wall biosynthesis
MTVSEPITATLAERYRLARRPALVLNVPVDDPRIRPGAVAGPTVRDAAALACDVPLLVYGGAVSRARGIEVLIDALAHLPGVHAAVVAVPHPHPLAPELLARAVSLGVDDRLHFCPPVDQDHLLHYLSGADVAVMPLRTGSANIEQALPNKLFENLHAGLTMVTSDAALISAFVREHELGEVFSFDEAGDDGARSLAAAVRRALANLRDPHGEHWEALRRTYSWQGQEPALRAVYADLVPPPNPSGIEDPTFCSLTLRPVPAGWSTPPADASDGDRRPAAATVVSPPSRSRDVVEERST